MFYKVKIRWIEEKKIKTVTVHSQDTIVLLSEKVQQAFNFSKKPILRVSIDGDDRRLKKLKLDSLVWHNFTTKETTVYLTEKNISKSIMQSQKLLLFILCRQFMMIRN